MVSGNGAGVGICWRILCLSLSLSRCESEGAGTGYMVKSEVYSEDYIALSKHVEMIAKKANAVLAHAYAWNTLRLLLHSLFHVILRREKGGSAWNNGGICPAKLIVVLTLASDYAPLVGRKTD